MTSSYLPQRILSIEIPYRRTHIDHVIDLIVPWIARLVGPILPRHELVLDQLEQLGITPPHRIHEKLLNNALREIFRILTNGWNRLDLSVLDQPTLAQWKDPGATLFLSMHHGQWEWLAGILTRMRPDALCIARSPHHPFGKWLLRVLRSRIGLRMVYDMESARAGKEQLGHGGLIAFLADQRPPGASRNGTWMGRPTSVTRLPEWWRSSGDIHLWTGVLHPGSTAYTLELKSWSSDCISNWDTLLDQEFFPLLQNSPWDHFGLWHHRLRTRRPSP